MNGLKDVWSGRNLASPTVTWLAAGPLADVQGGEIEHVRKLQHYL